MEVNVAAVIVLYYPDLQGLTRVIQELSKQVGIIIMVDNSDCHNEIEMFHNTRIIRNEENCGIAKALNQGITLAKTEGYNFVLLLDQDSFPSKNMTGKLLEGFNSFSNVALVSPVISDSIKKKNAKSIYVEHDYPITSGSLIRLSVFNNVGYFNENLFIDYVDFEFDIRVKQQGYSLVRNNTTTLEHQWGNVEKRHILGFTFYPSHHNALRRYYRIRNRFYVVFNYFKGNKVFALKSIFQTFQEIIEIVLFEEEKKLKLKSMLLGFVDFCKDTGLKKKTIM